MLSPNQLRLPSMELELARIPSWAWKFAHGPAKRNAGPEVPQHGPATRRPLAHTPAPLVGSLVLQIVQSPSFHHSDATEVSGLVGSLELLIVQYPSFHPSDATEVSGLVRA